MQGTGSRGSSFGLRAFVLAVAALLTLVLITDAADAARSKKPVRVKVSVKTRTQAALLSTRSLRVKVRSTGRVRLRLAAFQGRKGGFFRPAVIKFHRKHPRRARTVRLRLTRKGVRALSTCGAKKLRVVGTYRRHVRRHARKKKAKTVAKRRLTRQASRCRGPVKPPHKPPMKPPVEPPVKPAKSLCDPLDPTVCLQPWPSNFHTRPADTPTGLRLDLPLEAMPKNKAGTPIDQTDMNRADGFSPGNLITLKIPGVDTPAAFENTGFVPIDDMHDYSRPNQPVVVIDTATGERWPIWAELDSNPTSVPPTYDDDDNLTDAGGINLKPENTEPVNLIVRPARNFTPGHTYVVALRNLKDAQDRPVEAPAPFKACRDQQEIADPAVLYRCDTLEKSVFPVLHENGYARNDLYMAWDFTVASDESLTGRALEIRDDAFERLGDTDLDDLEVQGQSPEFRIDEVENYTEAENPQLLRQVDGTLINVPCYLDKDGCPTGSEFSFEDGKLTWNPDFTTEVPFRCDIPRSVVEDGEVVPLRPGLYGHGLLGDRNQVDAQDGIAFEHQMLFCGVDWAGFSDDDEITVGLSLLDVSNFNKMVDRMQQGFVNFLMVGRAMIHEHGLNTSGAFQVDPDGDGPKPAEPVIDRERLFYEGKSQGGIMGGALTALAPDFQRAVLNVPGMNYSTLLQRSVDFDEYANLDVFGLYVNYPDLAERQVVLSLMQLLWDRGEPNGFATHITDDPLPNTPPHEVLYQADVGDHQVANVTAEVAARTVGAKIYEPALDPGRHWDVDPFLGLDAIGSFPYGGSAIVYWDGGPLGWSYGGPECGESPGSDDWPCLGTAVAPTENVPPRPEWGFGGDPHSYSRDAIAGRQQASDFLQVDGFLNPCPGDGPCYANGWTGAP